MTHKDESGSHHGSRKIFFTNLFSQEVNSADHNSWKKYETQRKSCQLESVEVTSKDVCTIDESSWEGKQLSSRRRKLP
jgi:hypothetical protein